MNRQLTPSYVWWSRTDYDDVQEAEELKQAAMYLANLHYVSTSAAVRVVRDADADVEDARKGGERRSGGDGIFA